MRAAVAAALGLLLAACGGPAPAPGGGKVLRIGHFPNVTHAHGLVAHALTAEGKGWFEARLEPGTVVEWQVFNAGPSAMEALLAGTLDATYVGPSPAINAHARSGGAEVRVLAGATRGGAALVVRGDRGLKAPGDFRGRRVATPQLGNTQDVACRSWLQAGGLAVTPTGGDVQVLPTSNADILALFAKGDLDAAWTVEPWVSRLEGEAGGKVLVEETDVLTTVLACSARLLAERPALAARLAAAHRELGAWMRERPAEAKALVRAELKRGTTRDIDPALLDRCWARMRWEDALRPEDFDGFAAASVKAGLLREAPDLGRLVADPK